MSHIVKSQKQKKLSEDGFFSVFSVEFERWEQTVWTAFTVKFKKDGYLWFTNITRFCSRHYLECNFTTCVALVHNRLKTMLKQRYIDKKNCTINNRVSLPEKCPNTELFLFRIFLYSDWMQEDISPNTGKCEPEMTPYLDTLLAEYSNENVINFCNWNHRGIWF